MKATPILYSAPMVQAMLDGRKTQTRRIVKPQPYVDEYGLFTWETGRKSGHIATQSSRPDDGDCIVHHCPYGRRGDLLWVRETWRTDKQLDRHRPRDFSRWPVKYEADGAVLKHGAFHGGTDGKTRVSIHMPRWASRITQVIIGIRVERLQDISSADALAEGLAAISKDGELVKYGIPDKDGLPGTDNLGWEWSEWPLTPRGAYRKLWESINGPGTWEANPWVWVIETETHRCNIDELLAKRGAL